jgi:hypothetical protein
VGPPQWGGGARPAPPPDPNERIFVLGQLAEALWRVGDFEQSALLDEMVLNVAPGADLARWRLADALLMLHRPAAALEVLEPLCESDPGWRNSGTLCGIARARVRRNP